MPDSGQQFGVDIYHLHEVARDLSEAAAVYDSATNQMYGVVVDSIVDPWTSLRGQLLTALSTTVTNLNDSATALNKAANDYAATDQQAAAEFNKLCQQENPGTGGSPS